MGTKYYTPSLDEFKIGFRYEQKCRLIEYTDEGKSESILWKKSICSVDFPNPTLPMISNLINGGDIRVKHLDESDILEAGWKFKEQYTNKVYIFGNKFSEYYDLFLEIYSKNQIRIYQWDGNTDNSSTIFQGTIRNYNELIDVMRMLEIKK